MINKSGREAAVSPIIGTILLVAISVVLVAVIITVVMGFANADDGKKIGMNAKPGSGTNAQVILYGGDSLSDLVMLEMIDQNSPDGTYVEVWNKSQGDVSVGVPYPATDVAKPSESMDVYDTRINVKGTFTDGREVILLVQAMTFHNVEPVNKNGIKVNIGEPYISDGLQEEVGYLDYEMTILAFNIPMSIISTSDDIQIPSYDFVIKYRKAGTEDLPKSRSEFSPWPIGGEEYEMWLGWGEGIEPGTSYEVWGEVTYTDSTSSQPVMVEGPHKIFTTLERGLKMYGNVEWFPDDRKIFINMVFDGNVDGLTEGYLWYSGPSTDNQFIRGPCFKPDHNMGSDTTISDIYPGTYQVYVEVVEKDVTGNSSVSYTSDTISMQLAEEGGYLPRLDWRNFS